MTAGTFPSRLVARAAPLPACSRAEASILMVWTMALLRLDGMEPDPGPRRPGTGRPRAQGHGRAGLQGCRRRAALTAGVAPAQPTGAATSWSFRRQPRRTEGPGV